ncbi:outer membrane protein assembly factor [Flavobacteriales bacterium]|nr:outer membrane protein assembly factor [Flavobacteriales bacterium]
MSSCYTRKLNDGEYLLDKNKIITNNEKVDEADLSSVIKQRPNKKIFSVVKFHLMLHNLMDSTKVAKRELKKISRKNKRIKRKNIRKIRKEKDTISYRTSSNFDSFGEKLLYSIGEKPVVYNKNSASNSANQLHLYLIRKGFFNNTVKDSVRYIDRTFLGLKKKRAEVFYVVNVSDPFRIKEVTLKSKDTALLEKIKNLSGETLLNKSAIFDVDVLDDERERITNYLINNGYYKFNKNYIKFFIDSTVGTNEVSIVLDIDLFKEKIAKSDSIRSTPHSQYTISQVQINYTQDKYSDQNTTYFYKGIDFYIKGKNNINSNLFYRSLYLKPGDLYSKQKQQQMFKKLTSLGVFLTVNVFTEMDSIENSKGLKLTIKVEGARNQDYKIEANGTTSGSNFGIEGSFEYNFKNIFRGAELLHFGMSGALESQPLLLNDNTSDNTNIPLEINSFSNISNAFNTIEFGPEVSLTIPRLLFLSTDDYSNISNTKTIFKASLNYQRRLDQTKLDFERGIQELSFGYAWNIKSKFYHQLDPITLSAVEVIKSQAFQDRINSLNDRLLAASFQSHIISSTRYRFVYKDPNSKNKARTSLYYDANIESAGNTLNAFYKLTNKSKDAVTNSYNIAGIQFAQYVKTQHDLRVYTKINDKSSFVLRFLGGIGIPMENSSAALPFEKSFFAGGTDKTRAWKSRSLGPGSFRDSVLNFDKIGEILLEGNVEYRFDLLGFLDGALFVDAGNIWLMNEDSLRPGSQFKANKFLNQIAIGAGFGIRLDLDYFLIRLDIAYPLKNPTLIEGERWFFQPKDEYNSYINTIENKSQLPSLYSPQINIGIGFPF